jgi:hypothetical protein
MELLGSESTWQRERIRATQRGGVGIEKEDSAETQFANESGAELQGEGFGNQKE